MQKENSKRQKFFQSRFVPLALIGLSLLMILWGYRGGETQIVLAKAIRICMECVGIG